MRVRCGICHRVERWSADGARVVEIEGGSRRSMSPERDTFEILAESAVGELGPVVGVCPACAAPMVVEEAGEWPRIPWTVSTPRGPIVFGSDGSVGTPDGPGLEAAGRLIAATWPQLHDEDGSPYNLVRGSMFVMMLAPVAVWLAAVLFVVVFLSRIGTSVPRP